MKHLYYHVISYLIVLTICYLDIVTGAVYSLKILLILPFYIYSAHANNPLKFSIVYGFFVASAWTFIDVYLSLEVNTFANVLNLLIRITSLFFVSYLINMLKLQRIQLKKTNNELLQLIKEKNEFVGMAAHDLRSPISVIYSYTDLLKDYNGDNLTSKQIQIIDTIKQISNTMLLLLKDTLDFTKIESGSVVLNKMPYSYLTVINELLNEIKLFAKKKNISIEVECVEERILLNIDRQRINQIFQNLLSNAIKYSKNNTRIIIRVQKCRDMVQTEIIDQGIGICEDELEHIFKPFAYSSSKPTNGEESTGLGLAIVKKLVEAHGGTISVSSKLYAGTTLCFTLPE